MKQIAILLLAVATLAAQTQPAKSFVGTVAGFRPESAEVEIRPDRGDPVVARFTPDTIAQKIAPGEKDLKNAQSTKVSEVAAGDRVLVTLAPGTSDVRRIVVMPASDIARRNEADQMDWRKRGVAGIVSAKAGNRITLKTRTAAGDAEAVVTLEDKTTFKRYAPDSVRFSDARPSSLSEIKVGDQVRVLGDKGANGASIGAERIVSGSFRQIAATISSVNAQAGEIVVKDLATRKTIAVRVNSDSTMRRLPPAMAAALARRYQPGAATGENTGQALDRLPAMPLSELKPGDAIMLSSTTGSDPARVTAVMLLAGVEPLLTASPTATRDIMSGWNLGGGGDQ